MSEFNSLEFPLFRWLLVSLLTILSARTLFNKDCWVDVQYSVADCFVRRNLIYFFTKRLNGWIAHAVSTYCNIGTVLSAILLRLLTLFCLGSIFVRFKILQTLATRLRFFKLQKRCVLVLSPISQYDSLDWIKMLWWVLSIHCDWWYFVVGLSRINCCFVFT